MPTVGLMDGWMCGGLYLAGVHCGDGGGGRPVPRLGEGHPPLLPAHHGLAYGQPRGGQHQPVRVFYRGVVMVEC